MALWMAALLSSSSFVFVYCLSFLLSFSGYNHQRGTFKPLTINLSLFLTAFHPTVELCKAHSWKNSAALLGINKRHRWGERAAAFVKLRQWGFWTAFSSIHLANIRFLANKADELQLLNRANTVFCRSAALCFTETQLGEHIAESSHHLPGFQLLWADSVMELSGKTREGGICFYIKQGWFTDVKVLRKSQHTDGQVDAQHRHNQRKSPAKDALSVSSSSGAAVSVRLCNNWAFSLHIHHCVVWIIHGTGQTTMDSQYSRKIIGTSLPSTGDLNAAPDTTCFNFSALVGTTEHCMPKKNGLGKSFLVGFAFDSLTPVNL